LENLVMEQSKIKVVFFDFIGTTVIETRPDIISGCFKTAFFKNKISVSDNFIRSNRGRNKRDVIRDAITMEVSDERVNKILLDFETAVSNNLHHFQAVPEVEMIFETLRKKEIFLALATGLSRDIFDRIINGLGWSFSWFAYQATYEEIGKGRPHPDMIIDLMKALNITDSREILKVGDTVADMEEGKNAGTQTVAILAGTQPDDILFQANPDFLCRNLREILALIK
jgi:HAD superfamily hydrolase (TIGR01549 family)